MMKELLEIAQNASGKAGLQIQLFLTSELLVKLYAEIES